MAPKRISLNKQRDCLTLEYPDNTRHQLSAEYLRVFSPSAEVRGHGRGQEVLQFGKRLVTISSISKSGNYAIQIGYSDGHDSGIYSWDYLFSLATDKDANWDQYLDNLQQAGQSRDPDTQVVRLV